MHSVHQDCRKIAGDLARIERPTLVLGGEDDPVHLMQLERFEGCRHAIVPDAPERALAAIRDFIFRPK